MKRSRVVVPVAAAAAIAVGVLGFSMGRGASADGPAGRIAYLFVSGKGPAAKAWYDGGPPAGVQVQAALNNFSQQGFKVSAISSSGQPPITTNPAPAGPDSTQGADFVILLEKP
jgi:hypothetical protein